MQFLITGVAGFIGFHLTKTLLNEGHIVIGIDNFNDYYDPQLKLDRLTQLGILFDRNQRIYHRNNITIYNASIEDEKVWSELESHKIERIIHLAAQAGVRYSLTNPMSYVYSNIVGFQRVLDFSIKQNINDLMYASSSSVYGVNSKLPLNENEPCMQPESFYAATKKANELMAFSYFKTKNLRTLGLRFFTVYGPWGRPDMAPMLFASAATSNLPIKVYNNGDQSRDFTYIDDIVSGIVQCLNINLSEPLVLNIGRGSSVLLLDFIKEIERNFNIDLIKEFKPAQLGDVKETFADTTKLQELTGYKPKFDLEEGIRLFAEWYKDYYKS
jgi:UDP-glucuronate 4-epimerase